jgi:hypothetical protein
MLPVSGFVGAELTLRACLTPGDDVSACTELRLVCCAVMCLVAAAQGPLCSCQ